MFKDDYKAAFSKVTASEETHRRLLNMAKETKKRRSLGGWAGKLLIAAVLLSLLTVTASAAVKNWFVTYFEGKTEQPLTQEQVAFVEENTQNFGQSVTQNGWTLELRSAISDGNRGYILLGVTAPETVDLSEIPQKSGLEYYGPSNDYLPKDENAVLNCSAYPDVSILANITTCWEEDGDGRGSTLNYVIDVTPDLERAQVNPFGTDAKWHIHIENLVHGFPEQVVLAEGVWDFDFTFENNGTAIELLTQPIKAKAYATLPDGTDVESVVTITSVTLRAFGAEVTYGSDEDGLDYSRTSVDFTWFASGQSPWYAVMKDGTEMRMVTTASDPANRICTLGTDAPIAMQNVDCILLPDGNKLPMPELPTE